jgi:hypothetical protein
VTLVQGGHVKKHVIDNSDHGGWLPRAQSLFPYSTVPALWLCTFDSIALNESIATQLDVITLLLLKKIMVDKSPSSGLWKRQSSLVEPPPEGPDNTSVNDNMEIEAALGSGVDSVPLLRAASSNVSGEQDQAPASLSSANTNTSQLVLAELMSAEHGPIYKDMALAALFCFFGVSIVPSLIFTDIPESMRTENIPYQKTAAGDVILDFRLNHPLVHPATVPCECNVLSSLFCALARMTYQQ